MDYNRRKLFLYLYSIRTSETFFNRSFFEHIDPCDHNESAITVRIFFVSWQFDAVLNQRIQTCIFAHLSSVCTCENIMRILSYISCLDVQNIFIIYQTRIINANSQDFLAIKTLLYLGFETVVYTSELLYHTH